MVPILFLITVIVAAVVVVAVAVVLVGSVIARGVNAKKVLDFGGNMTVFIRMLP